jgi:AcrR family transcriptional regulator
MSPAGDEAPLLRRRSSRDALIGAALAEFSEKGYEAATVTGVAERAGVTTGALYAHFGGKLDLLLRALGLMPPSALFRELAEVATQPWHEVLRVLSESLAATPEPATLLLLDAIVAARRDDKVAETLRERFAAYEDTIRRATEAGVASGLLDPALQAEDLSRVLTLLSLGRLAVAAIGGPAPSGAAYERLAELFLQASGAAPPSDPIEAVRVRAAALDRARRDLADGVAAAIGEGHSLRQVGAAAGVSHERVRQILRER